MAEEEAEAEAEAEEAGIETEAMKGTVAGMEGTAAMAVAVAVADVHATGGQSILEEAKLTDLPRRDQAVLEKF